MKLLNLHCFCSCVHSVVKQFMVSSESSLHMGVSKSRWAKSSLSSCWIRSCRSGVCKLVCYKIFDLCGSCWCTVVCVFNNSSSKHCVSKGIGIWVFLIFHVGLSNSSLLGFCGLSLLRKTWDGQLCSWEWDQSDLTPKRPLVFTIRLVLKQME